MIGNRRRARESALQLLYQDEFHTGGAREAVAHFWTSFAERDPARAEFVDEIRSFCMNLVDGVRQNAQQIDALIRGAAKNWRLERMSRVDRNILRMATFELLALSDIPPKVTLNEAIEIAKAYGSEDSSAFINGILDKISRQVRPHGIDGDDSEEPSDDDETDDHVLPEPLDLED